MVGRGPRWILLVLLGFPMGHSLLSANNLQITSIFCDQFHLRATIAWDNSWNLSTAPFNHDAVWLFAKVKHNSAEWQPARFSTELSAHSCGRPELLGLEPAAMGEGIMLRNVGNGAGHVPATEIALAWDQPLPSGLYEVALFGIEMAWIPEGPFWVGDGASNFALHDSTNGQAYRVDSENEIGAAVLAANGGKGPEGAIGAEFPKGFGGFYLMKYELSQAQYADFLNKLTYPQQQARTVVGPNGQAGTPALSGASTHRNAIVLAKPSTEIGQPATFACDLDGGAVNGDHDGSNRACNWLSWGDLAAYLDWAGLRPITELEFEKACRGPLPPVVGEFAWGTDAVVDANTVLNDGTATETVQEAATTTAGLGSHGYDGPDGPLRCGFGANDHSDRLQAGAGYYGNLELSGNLWELCVTSRAGGRSFTRTYGDGRITENGDADVAGWPDASGVGFKGGGWNSGIVPGFRDLAVSDRFYIDLAADMRRNTTGGRGGR